MTSLLWVLLTLGAWNLVNLVARAYYRQWSWQYAGSVIFGIWAAYLLLRGVYAK